MEVKRYSQSPAYKHLYSIFIYIFIICFPFVKDTKLISIICSFGFALGFVSCYWNTRLHIFQCYVKDKKGSFILFNNRLEKVNRESSKYESFESENQKYLISETDVFPLVSKNDVSTSEMRKGVITKDYLLFPDNEFKVPNPSFSSMFKEQCVTPVFCFQILSSLLMCFDEHVMNALFSTAIIIFAEATFVLSRFSTMKVFRKLEHAACEIRRTYKGNGIKVDERIPSTLLRPGDKICIESPAHIPCDLVILDGSCAVNEAMLSGESTPLLKEEITCSDEPFSLAENKRHVLYAGTNIEKIYSPLTCYVLRTGFNTEQGILLNKMLHSEDIKYDPEALKFILLLCIIAFVNSFFTFKYSKKTGYALFLDVIILFTNSIPFELPMEMNISIQSCVKNLMSKKVYCLEPFRISLAGKVSVCCFDKTGTLVDSKLEVKKIEHTNNRTNAVLSCCHNLISINDELRGDPLEIAIFTHDFDKKPFKILQQFSFSSELKRQCVVAEVEEQKKNLLFCMKGAPEAVEKFLKYVPDVYSDYKKFASQGYRVIALACKTLNLNDIKLVPNRLTDRKYLEKDLEFCGFVLLGSSLRHYAKEMCVIIKNAGLKTIMITGDSLLTAMNVADQLQIPGKGVEGDNIDKIIESKDFLDYSVFGRADPKHKEMIIKKYKSLNHTTMMVGDGTNDVGALKASDVGVAMLETVETAPIRPRKQNMTLAEKLRAEAAELESIKPGDASIAAPFTVKSNSLRSIVDIIQQGRSSLVTTIQMYKILALNSIISAFFYMFVDILGVKFSDHQMLSLGILSSIAFTAISQPKSLDFISKQKPITSIFSMYIFSSILLQSIIQVGAIYLVYKNIPLPKPVDKFEPSVMNTVLLIVSAIQYGTTVICNYIGRPFREDITENKILGISLLSMAAYIGNIIFKLKPEINDMIEVVDITVHSKFMIGLCISTFVLCYISEKMAFKLFMIGNKN